MTAFLKMTLTKAVKRNQITFSLQLPLSEMSGINVYRAERQTLNTLMTGMELQEGLADRSEAVHHFPEQGCCTNKFRGGTGSSYTEEEEWLKFGGFFICLSAGFPTVYCEMI